jgi:hypothetical protein
VYIVVFYYAVKNVLLYLVFIIPGHSRDKLNLLTAEVCIGGK